MMAKNIQIKIEIPIPLARSLALMAANMANEVKTMESITPITNNENPTSKEEYKRIGIPHPIKNAKTNAVESPRNKLNQTLLLAMG